MHFLIDTYNLLHAAIAMAGPLRDMSVRKLCQYLAAAPVGIKATLVLDGRPKPDEPSLNEFPDITLHYSGTGVPADTVIAQLVERSKSRKSITVVTNDRAVALHARRHFANALSCEQFLHKLTEFTPRAGQDPSAKPAQSSSPGELDHWLQEFGLGDPDPNPQPRLAPDTNPDDLNIEDLLGPRDPPPSPKTP